MYVHVNEFAGHRGRECLACRKVARQANIGCPAHHIPNSILPPVEHPEVYIQTTETAVYGSTQLSHHPASATEEGCLVRCDQGVGQEVPVTTAYLEILEWGARGKDGAADEGRKNLKSVAKGGGGSVTKVLPGNNHGIPIMGRMDKAQSEIFLGGFCCLWDPPATLSRQ